MVYILSIETVGLGSLIMIVGWMGLRMGDWLVGGLGGVSEWGDGDGVFVRGERGGRGGGG